MRSMVMSIQLFMTAISSAYVCSLCPQVVLISLLTFDFRTFAVSGLLSSPSPRTRTSSSTTRSWPVSRSPAASSLPSASANSTARRIRSTTSPPAWQTLRTRSRPPPLRERTIWIHLYGNLTEETVLARLCGVVVFEIVFHMGVSRTTRGILRFREPCP
jgi:hypothetical protein